MPLHTDRQYEEELQRLRAKILEMGGIVEKQIGDAMISLVERNSSLAREVIERDLTVNYLDVAVDEACTRLLALHQPAGRDLRLVMTSLKITTDLERIGDIAQNICERAIELNQEPPLKPYVDLPRMANWAQSMLRDSLDAFVREDTELALQVCQRDDFIDNLTAQLFREMLSYMAQDPQSVGRATRILFLAKYLERIADHATNIAEMVIYMVKGKSIRHMSPPPASV
ncbi:MAG TPA: phosphate signaling complex protein PhoU [Candidatus Binatia bacterium]|jgi:phosphate transport system protein|nr:phosphate signaling complex protein PhoU [Candidatus Binatia bacterium]